MDLISSKERKKNWKSEKLITSAAVQFTKDLLPKKEN